MRIIAWGGEYVMQKECREDGIRVLISMSPCLVGSFLERLEVGADD